MPIGAGSAPSAGSGVGCPPTAAGSHRVSSDRATASTDTSRVRDRAGSGRLHRTGQPPLLLQTPQLDQDGVQPLSLDVLHHVVMQPAFLADAEDRHDVGVVQACRRARLPLEPLPLLPVGEHLSGQDLQRHVPAQRDLFGLVDDPHAAAADLAQDAVIAQALGVLEASPAQ